MPCEYPGCTKTFKICGTTQATIACHMKHHHREGNGGLCLRAVCVHVCSCWLRVCCVCVPDMWCVVGADVLCVCAEDEDAIYDQMTGGMHGPTDEDFESDDNDKDADVL